MKCLSPSPAALRFVNFCERNSTYKKESITVPGSLVSHLPNLVLSRILMLDAKDALWQTITIVAWSTWSRNCFAFHRIKINFYAVCKYKKWRHRSSLFVEKTCLKTWRLVIISRSWELRHHLQMRKNLASGQTAFHSSSFTHLRKCQIVVPLTLEYLW